MPFFSPIALFSVSVDNTARRAFTASGLLVSKANQDSYVELFETLHDHYAVSVFLATHADVPFTVLA